MQDCCIFQDFSALGLNFINVLRTAFTSKDPRSVKNTVKFSIFITLLGSTSAKAAGITLVKLTPACSTVAGLFDR